MIEYLLYAFLGMGLIVVLVLLLGLLYKRMLIPVEMVNAGAHEGRPSFASRINSSVSPFESFYHNGKKVDTGKFIIRKVDGDCMAPRDIFAGDLLFIEPFNGNPDSFSKGDILYIKDKSDFKIREFYCFDSNNPKKLKTLFYKSDRAPKWHDPDSYHDISQVEGVVKMKFSR